MDPSSEETAPSKEYDASDEASEISDAECVSTFRKEPNVSMKPLQCAAMHPSPELAASDHYSEVPKGFLGNVTNIKTEKSGLELSSTKRSDVGNIKEHDADDSTKSTQKEVIDPSQDKASRSKGATSETQDTGANSSAVNEESPEDAAAKALMSEYENKYANVYSKELLFAVDLMTLVRLLNKCEVRYIMYATSGKAPESPCDDTLDQALHIIWQAIRNSYDLKLESVMKKNKGMKFHHFQDMMFHIAKGEEALGWKDEKCFLTICLMFAQSAVYAEKNGIKDACEFIPLLICRIIQHLKVSGHFPVDFWKKIAAFAEDVIKKSKSES